MGYFARCVFLSLFGIVIYIFWSPFRFPRLRSSRDDQIWRLLAKSHKLNFLPGDDGADTFVSGTYGGHFLTLRTVQHTGRFYTLISVNRQLAPPKEITETVLNSLLALAVPWPLSGALAAEPGGDRLTYQQPDIETDFGYLSALFKLLLDLI